MKIHRKKTYEELKLKESELKDDTWVSPHDFRKAIALIDDQKSIIEKLATKLSRTRHEVKHLHKTVAKWKQSFINQKQRTKDLNEKNGKLSQGVYEVDFLIREIAETLKGRKKSLYQVAHERFVAEKYRQKLHKEIEDNEN